MTHRPRAVVDTSVLVSRLLLAESIPAKALSSLLESHQLLASEATFEELAEVLSRSKFDRYVTLAERKEFIRLLGRVVEWVVIVHRVRACRDARDDKFLELAVNGGASTIVTGDTDLLVLHPFRDIRILTPADFLKQAG